MTLEVTVHEFVTVTEPRTVAHSYVVKEELLYWEGTVVPLSVFHVNSCDPIRAGPEVFHG